LIFEVDEDGTPLYISVFDIDRGQLVMETSVTFEDLKSELVPKEEFWINMRENDPSSSRLRLKINYE